MDPTVRRLSRLTAALVADALDHCGKREQILSSQIRPLYPEARVVGVALPVLAAPVYEVPTNPYEKEFQAVDALKPDQVIVVSMSGNTRCAFWGELLSTAAIARGARGAVIDGFTRDAAEIIKMGFPLFCTGVHPGDSMGRSEVVDFGVAVDCCGVRVRPGDYVVGDYDGVVVVPQEEAGGVLAYAEEKLRTEDKVREQLRAGRKVTEVYREYGVM